MTQTLGSPGADSRRAQPGTDSRRAQPGTDWRRAQPGTGAAAVLRPPLLPQPRGPLSELVIASLREPVHQLASVSSRVGGRPLEDEDLQLALYLCYELHYRGFAGADEAWEWEPSLLELRRGLEERFEAGLRAAVPSVQTSVRAGELDVALRAVVGAHQAPSLGPYIARLASVEQVHEFVVHRSAYQLKEADPHSWAIPRLEGRPKAALIEIQADEYGGGRPERVHAELFAKCMRGMGLDSSYGAYLDLIPAITLATVNLMSLLGLHRRWRGAIVGHLAAFEMGSSIPNRRYATGLRRLGFGEEVTDFFDEHVVADAVHENIAAVDLAGGLADQEPALIPGILWGARALLELDGLLASALLAAWEQGGSLLRADAGETRLQADAGETRLRADAGASPSPQEPAGLAAP